MGLPCEATATGVHARLPHENREKDGYMRISTTLFVGATALAATAALATPAAAQAEFSEDTWYQLVNVNSELCLEEQGAGENVEQHVCGDRPGYESNRSQHWRFQQVEDGSYELVNREASDLAGTDVVLDVHSDSSEADAAVIVWEYHGGANQKWEPIVHEDGSFEIRGFNSQLCVDVLGGSTEVGATASQHECLQGSSPEQSFFLNPVGQV